MENLPPSAPPPPPSHGLTEKQWIIALHLSGLLGLLVPLTNIVAPLVIWLLKKEEIPSLDLVGKNVLNFQISWTLYMIVAAASMYVCIGFVILPLLAIAWIIFLIMGAVKASNGETYQFPLTIKML